MRIDICARKVKVDAKVRAYVEEKINALSKVLKRFEAKADVPVAVDIFPDTRHHRRGDIIAITIAVHLPNKTILVHQTAPDVMSGVDVAKEILQREIIKFKDRLIEKRNK
jgi:ribosomal subunit interface protein